jgi:hypothetical protein
MKVVQWQSEARGIDAVPAPLPALPGAQLALVFGGRHLLDDEKSLAPIRAAYPAAHVVGCSTAGEIAGVHVHDDSLVVTAVRFERSRLEARAVLLPEGAENPSRDAGAALARALPHDGLKHVFVLSDGLGVNGSELVRGLTASLPTSVSVTGGLSADGDRFEKTLVVADGAPGTRRIAAVGLYGDALEVGYASLGGWDPFGPERVVTRAEGNVLYELDGQPALDLYRSYLGEHAAGLPATGLLFPLALRDASGSPPVVRTLLGVDESKNSMTFAGDLPVGSFARLMRANFDRLVEGAAGAARIAGADAARDPALALLISCVGRKMVLKQRVEEEVEAVREVLGDDAVLTGFYSYGEISPFTPNARCELHNQTMTITTIRENV